MSESTTDARTEDALDGSTDDRRPADLPEECTLCGLPTGDAPITDDVLDESAEEVPGAYCCRGCLEIARTVEEVESVDAEAVRDERGGGGVEDAPDDADHTYLGVDGMHCATCETFIESAAADAEGVHAADASYATDMLRVAHDEETDLDALGRKLDRYGYAVGDPEGGTAADDRADNQIVRFLLGGGIFGMMVM